MKILVTLLLLNACASTAPYKGKAKTVTVRESVVEVLSVETYDFSERVNKIVSINNPHDRNVEVSVDCGWDSRWNFVIAAKTTQFVLVTPQRKKLYRKTCYITEWAFTNDPPQQ